MKDRESSEPLNLAGELRRRKVLYTAVVYGISAFAITEIAAFLFDSFGAPAWADRLLAALFVAGFPVAIFLSWAFDIGADGIVRAPTRSRRHPRTVVALALALLVVTTGGLFYLIFPEHETPAAAGAPSAAPGVTQSDYGFEPAEKLENSIAVLPFENLSADPDDAFFSTGVAEEVLNHLGSYRELNIIGRTSSFVFGDGDFAVPKISALLGVRFLLQGSVRRHLDQVRVSTQLLDENGRQLWSRNFDRRLDDIFAIQTEIATAVAEAVVPEVTSRPTEFSSTNLEAYDHYLRGRELVYQRKGFEAIEALERAVELDPAYAPAHAELGVVYGMGSNAELDKAGKAIDTALSLQPGLLRAQAARGLMLMQQGDAPAAEAILRRVLAQEPSMTDAINWLSGSLTMQGRDEEAFEISVRGLRMDPLHTALSRNVARDYADRGEDERAIAIARRVIESPEAKTYHPYVILFRLYRGRGRLVDAAEIAREWTFNSAPVDPSSISCYCMMVWAHSLLGNEALTDYWVERSRLDFGDSFWTGYFETFVTRWRGRYHDALVATTSHFGQFFGHEGEFPNERLMQIGVLESLSGDYSSAIERLAPLRDGVNMSLTGEGWDAVQALAWAYQNSGQAKRAEALLAELESKYEALAQQGTLLVHLQDIPYGYALNAALRGEHERALERLEAIIEAGWRTYYVHHHDPRWGALRGDPRFRSLMARVKADVDRQRADLEALESHDAFIARLEARIAAPEASPAE